MTITRVQAGGALGDNATSVSRAYDSNVTAGNMVVVTVAAWDNGGDPGDFTDGSCTKIAGTATLGTITKSVSRYYNTSLSYHEMVGIWTAIVTGSGSLTMQVAGLPSGSYSVIATMEYSCSSGWDASRLETSLSSDGTSEAPDTGNVTSAGQALFIGALAYASGATTITGDAAFSTIYESEDGANHETGSFLERIVSTGTTDSASWTAQTTLKWAAAVAVYKGAAASIFRRTDSDRAGSRS